MVLRAPLIIKRSLLLAQQITVFLSQNCDTVEVLVGTAPSGLMSYVSLAYGGFTSDRQLVEHVDLVSCCE